MQRVNGSTLRLVALPLMAVLLPALGPSARAEVQFLDSERTATIHGEAGQGKSFFDECDDQQSWTDTAALDDYPLICFADAGYGHARSLVRIPSSTVSESGFSTLVSAAGDFVEDGYFDIYGSFLSEYRQTYEFQVVGNALLDLTGRLGQTWGSSATLTLHRNGIEIAHFMPVVEQQDEEPAELTLDEHIPLVAGEYLCVLDLEGKRIPIPYIGNHGSAFADVQVTLGDAVSVQSRGWGRIKAMYR